MGLNLRLASGQNVDKHSFKLTPVGAGTSLFRLVFVVAAAVQASSIKPIFNCTLIVVGFRNAHKEASPLLRRKYLLSKYLLPSGSIKRKQETRVAKNVEWQLNRVLPDVLVMFLRLTCGGKRPSFSARQRSSLSNMLHLRPTGS